MDRKMAPAREERHWAFAANPQIYRIEDAVRERETDLWTVRRSRVQAGDRAIIWKTSGRERRRGIVALAEVLSDPEVCVDVPNPYWVDPEAGYEAQERVLVRYIHAPLLPLWLGDEGAGILAELSVSRATGGTVFRVTVEQWDEIVELPGGWPN